MGLIKTKEMDDMRVYADSDRSILDRPVNYSPFIFEKYALAEQLEYGKISDAERLEGAKIEASNALEATRQANVLRYAMLEGKVEPTRENLICFASAAVRAAQSKGYLLALTSIEPTQAQMMMPFKEIQSEWDLFVALAPDARVDEEIKYDTKSDRDYSLTNDFNRTRREIDREYEKRERKDRLSQVPTSKMMYGKAMDSWRKDYAEAGVMQAFLKKDTGEEDKIEYWKNRGDNAIKVIAAIRESCDSRWAEKALIQQ